MPTKAELEAKVAELEAKLERAADLINEYADAEEAAAKAAKAAPAPKAKPLTSLGTIRGPIAVLTDVENLNTRWSQRSTAAWVVDVSGPHAEELTKHGASHTESFQQLADGTFRIKCSNQNAAMMIVGRILKRIKGDVDRFGSSNEASAKPLRGSPTAAEDATRNAQGFGMFTLENGFAALGLKGPLKVETDGERVILSRG